MHYMLDTDICIYIIKKKPAQVLQRLKKSAISDIAISSITLSELEYGIAKSSQPEQNRAALIGFLAPLEIVHFDEKAAFHYGKIRSLLESEGKMIGAMDLLIASHARSLSLTLVTNNVKEFKRIPKLQLENWV
ncbi:MAG: type II toxin-antitoxin system VapC family toxin [Deltaproteobacteria bacterium]|nr:type II toxin-antitoxin system VapC family toxin [Deltaproteobacteria bacterium]